MLKDEMTSLGELAVELGLKKSVLNYYFNNGLLSPEYSVGKLNVFNKAKALKSVKKILLLKKEGKKLKEIKTLL